MFDYLFLKVLFYSPVTGAHKQDTYANEITYCTTESVVYQIIHFKRAGLAD